MNSRSRVKIAALVAAVFFFLTPDGVCAEKDLIQVATSERQWTGIAVSRSGRVFVNFPRWSPEVPVSVGELGPGGEISAYPGEVRNRWEMGKDAGESFVCVQSVHVDRRDRLWILDPANPFFEGVVEGGPKLVQVDLASDAVVRIYHFDESIAPEASYLNDVRIDTLTETAFITESGLGAIVVVDLESGRARRLLADHPSTKAQKIRMTIGGRPFSIEVHADGIALDQEQRYLYYQALTGRTLYRVPVAALLDTEQSAKDLGAEVEAFAESGVSDGLLFGPGGIYVSALEEDSIKRVGEDGSVSTVIQDPRISWPDSFALGPDDSVWFTTAQIHLGPNPPTPYRVFRLPPPGQE